MWKQRYAALTQTIRDLKFARKFHPEAVTKGERYQRIVKEHSTQFGFYPATLAMHKYRPMATAQLLELADAKVEAQRQYLASKGLAPANQ